MDKDEVIKSLTNMVIELLRIGQDKMQEVTNLLCTIEQLPKDISLPKNVIELKKKTVDKICPRCKVNNRTVTKSGRLSPYCKQCNAEKAKSIRLKNAEKNTLNNTHSFNLSN